MQLRCLLWADVDESQSRERVRGFDLDRPSTQVQTHLRQLQAITAAYKTSASEEPYLLFSSTVLPDLLAFRNISRMVKEAHAAVPETYAELNRARENLATEESHLQANLMLTDALQNRITRLREELATKSQKSSDEAAKNRLIAEKDSKKIYQKETRRFMRTLVTFIHDQLAPMLAAEELGGPVVGDVLVVDDDVLASGFTAKGKAKRRKAVQNSNAMMERQRRIDDIWGQADREADGEENEERTERETAGEDMQALIEQLLNVVAEQGYGTYVTLERDSAAARFLVRAKVALLHPRDARKIRLVDFAQDIED